MLGGWILALTVAAGPGQCGPGGCGFGGGMGGMEFAPGMASGSFVAGQGGFSNPYDSVSAGGGGGGDQLYPFDSPEPWLHGYFQELPAHGGYASFRPHNYKHVLAQMEVASRWGMSPVMAYSHQWYHRYRQRSGMHPNFGTGTSASLEEPRFGHVASYQNSENSTDQQYSSGTASSTSSERMSAHQQAAAFQQGYTGTAIPGITTPYYQRSVSQPISSPAESVSAEYLERMDQLQRQLEDQTFQMQLMQQRLQAQDQSRLPAWQQPNHMQFRNDGASQEPRQLQQFAAAPGQGYQELPAPGAYPQAGYGQPASPNYAPPAGQQNQPTYQQQPSQYQAAPASGYQQGYGGEPAYQAPAAAAGGPAMNPVMTVPPQAYYAAPQNNAASGYGAQPQRSIQGTHAAWQQNSGPSGDPAYSGQYGAAAPAQQFAPATPLVPQQSYQQMQYTQPGSYPASGYQPRPAGQGAYYYQQ